MSKAEIMDDIVTKPYHLLDILKLYGKRIENFIPDINYEHCFYRLSNKVIRKEVQFTRDGDDI